jgi:hypothetical protein
MRRRLSARLVHAALAASLVSLASSGCLTLLDIDDGPYAVGDGGENGSKRGDAAKGDAAGEDDDADATGDDDAPASSGDGGAMMGHDGSVDAGDSSDGSYLSPQLCDASGWHPDCTFGTDGFALAAYNLIQQDQSIRARMLDGGTWAIVATPDEANGVSHLVMVAADGGVSPSVSVGLTQVGDVQALPDGGLVVLGSSGDTIEALLLGGEATFLATGAPPMGRGLSWLAVGTSALTAAAGGPGAPGTIEFDSSPIVFTATGGTLTATKAVEIAPDDWYIGGDGGEAYERVPVTGPGLRDESCLNGALAFTDLDVVDGFPVALAPTAAGFELRDLSTCASNAEPLAAATIAGATIDGGPPVALPYLAQGVVGDAGALAVVGSMATGHTLYVGHLPVRYDGGAGDTALQLTAPGAGARTDIALPVDAIVGPPALAAGMLYVPLVTTMAGDDAIDLLLLRLVYTPPP